MEDYLFALGFIAGEGSFSLTHNKADEKVYTKVSFQVQVHTKDKELLLEIKKLFNDIGSIQKSKSNLVSWMVASKEDLAELRKLLNNNNCELWEASEKFENYSVWSEILDIHLDGKNSKCERIEMMKMAKNLNKENGTSPEKWDSLIKEVKSYESYVCGFNKSSEEGNCQRPVTNKNETCFEH